MSHDELKNVLYLYMAELVGGDDSFNGRDCALIDQLSELYIEMRRNQNTNLRLYSHIYLKNMPTSMSAMARNRETALEFLLKEDPVSNNATL